MSNIVRGTTFQVEHALESLDGHRWPCLLGATRTSSVCENIRLPFFKKCWAVAIDYRMRCWAEAHVKITRMTLTIKLDRNWSSFQLANSTPPLSVTGSAIAPSARMLRNTFFEHTFATRHLQCYSPFRKDAQERVIYKWLTFLRIFSKNLNFNFCKKPILHKLRRELCDCTSLDQLAPWHDSVCQAWGVWETHDVTHVGESPIAKCHAMATSEEH